MTTMTTQMQASQIMCAGTLADMAKKPGRRIARRPAQLALRAENIAVELQRDQPEEPRKDAVLGVDGVLEKGFQSGGFHAATMNGNGSSENG